MNILIGQMFQARETAKTQMITKFASMGITLPLPVQSTCEPLQPFTQQEAEFRDAFTGYIYGQQHLK
jgi:hypothetical protein